MGTNEIDELGGSPSQVALSVAERGVTNSPREARPALSSSQLEHGLALAVERELDALFGPTDDLEAHLVRALSL